MASQWLLEKKKPTDKLCQHPPAVFRCDSFSTECQRKEQLSVAPHHPSSSLRPSSPDGGTWTSCRSSNLPRGRWALPCRWALQCSSSTGHCASFITRLTHSCCLPEAHAHTAGRCTPTQCHAVKLTITLAPNTESILFVSRRWSTLGFNVSRASGDRWFNNYETWRFLQMHQVKYNLRDKWIFVWDTARVKGLCLVHHN